MFNVDIEIYIYIRFIFKVTNRIMTTVKEQVKQQTYIYIIIIIIAKVSDVASIERVFN